jgi:hypothetical protein
MRTRFGKEAKPCQNQDRRRKRLDEAQQDLRRVHGREATGEEGSRREVGGRPGRTKGLCAVDIAMPRYYSVTTPICPMSKGKNYQTSTPPGGRLDREKAGAGRKWKYCWRGLERGHGEIRYQAVFSKTDTEPQVAPLPCRFRGQEVLVVANRSKRAAASGLAWSCSFCASIDLHNLLKPGRRLQGGRG